MILLLGLLIGLTSSLISEGAAWAPSPISTAVEAQRAIGYDPCTPRVGPLPLEIVAEGVAADAAPTFGAQECEIRMAYNMAHSDLDWVAWHEVCHLSTLNLIHDAGEAHEDTDWAHENYRFQDCIRQGPVEQGGYLK